MRRRNIKFINFFGKKRKPIRTNITWTPIVCDDQPSSTSSNVFENVVERNIEMKRL